MGLAPLKAGKGLLRLKNGVGLLGAQIAGKQVLNKTGLKLIASCNLLNANLDEIQVAID